MFGEPHRGSHARNELTNFAIYLGLCERKEGAEPQPHPLLITYQR